MFRRLSLRLLLCGLCLLPVTACGMSPAGSSARTPSVATTAPPPSIPLAPSATASNTIHFPQLTPQTGERAFPAALLPGQFVLENDCLRIRYSEDQTSYLIIWPPDVTLHITSNAIEIHNPYGKVLAQVGEQIQVGGGEITPEVGLIKELRQPLPKECPGPYWIASDISRQRE